MPFPTAETLPDDAARLLIIRAKSLRSNAVSYIAQCDAGAINVHDVGASFMAGLLGPTKVEFAALVAIPGIYEELARQKPNSFASAAAAQTAVGTVQSALNTLITFLEGNLPVDAQRRLLSLALSNDVSGTLTQRTITAAGSIASFRSALVTFRDAFDA
jgi:hypothetical protein